MKPPSTNFHLIDLREVIRFRRGGRNEQGNDFPIRQSRGRARCRLCGQKIAKGIPAHNGFYDFGGCGSWTSSEVWFHVFCPIAVAPDCPWCKEPLDGEHDLTCPWHSQPGKQIREVLGVKP